MSQRPRTSRSAFALYARTLREERGLTQEELAKAAKVHVSTIKNVECDRDVSIDTVGAVYRDGLPKKHRLDPAQWNQLVGYWLLVRFPAGISLPAVAEGIRAVEDASAASLDARARSLLAAVALLPDTDADTILAIAKAATGKRGPAILATLRSLLEL